jgi:hypothetical protein
MKQVKLTQFEAATIYMILKQVDHKETFRNDPQGGLIHYENMTRNMILSLEQLLQAAQADTRKKVG